jgi:microcystin-dependent protein
MTIKTHGRMVTDNTVGIPQLAVTDGSPGQAIVTDGAGTMTFATVGAASLPAGGLIPYAGATAPAGWLLCFGQAISRTVYSTLFTAIGTIYGVGDGSTTFTLPDMRGQGTAGLDNMGGTSRNRVVDTNADVLGGEIGDSGGHTHTHSLSAGAHTLTEAEIPSHSHTVPLNTTSGGGEDPIGACLDINNMGASPVGTTSTGGGGSHAHNMSGSITSQEALQPTIFLNYIIKT